MVGIVQALAMERALWCVFHAPPNPIRTRKSPSMWFHQIRWLELELSGGLPGHTLHAGLSLSEAADWLLSPTLTQSCLFPRDMHWEVRLLLLRYSPTWLHHRSPGYLVRGMWKRPWGRTLYWFQSGVMKGLVPQSSELAMCLSAALFKSNSCTLDMMSSLLSLSQATSTPGDAEVLPLRPSGICLWVALRRDRPQGE